VSDLTEDVPRSIENGVICNESNGLRWCEIYGREFTAGVPNHG